MRIVIDRIVCGIEIVAVSRAAEEQGESSPPFLCFSAALRETDLLPDSADRDTERLSADG
ncbi:MAG TPA: hypothetical protein VFR81_05995 [Longimicrobium sp.]|nr:hypothetical protein [Longimicrobium sp.]